MVDGDINNCNIADVFAAGADSIVSGRAVFTSKNPLQLLNKWSKMQK